MTSFPLYDGCAGEEKKREELVKDPPPSVNHHHSTFLKNKNKNEETDMKKWILDLSPIANDNQRDKDRHPFPYISTLEVAHPDEKKQLVSVCWGFFPPWTGVHVHTVQKPRSLYEIAHPPKKHKILYIT